MRTVQRDHGLAIFFGIIFLAALLGQALTGVAEYNNQQITTGLQQITFGQYVTSSSFAVDVAENWQSEYLQSFLYIFATVWLLQKGSPGIQTPGQPGHRIRRGTEGRGTRRPRITGL